jgi:hypothetical protein
MATSIDQKTHIRTALRVPPELHAQIHEAAAASGRSFNAEIIHRLERSFTRNHVSHVQAGASPAHDGGGSAVDSISTERLEEIATKLLNTMGIGVDTSRDVDSARSVLLAQYKNREHVAERLEELRSEANDVALDMRNSEKLYQELMEELERTGDRDISRKLDLQRDRRHLDFHLKTLRLRQRALDSEMKFLEDRLAAATRAAKPSPGRD